MPVRSLEIDSAAFEDLVWWVRTDRKKALRVLRLIQETQSDPVGGIGKPEPLKHELAGCWSKRIDTSIVSCTKSWMLRFASWLAAIITDRMPAETSDLTSLIRPLR